MTYINTNDKNRSIPKVAFFAGWLPLYIYVFLVVWTPIIPMSPLPPLRFDDIWLFIWLAGSFLTAQHYGNTKLPLLLLALVGLVAVLTTASTFINGISIGRRPAPSELFDAFVFIRMALVILLISRARSLLSPIKGLTYAMLLSVSSTVPIIFIQAFSISPYDEMTIRLWTNDNIVYQLQFFQHGVLARAVGTIGNPNYLGIFLVLNIASCMYAILVVFKRYGIGIKILSSAMLFVSLYIIVFHAMSRTALVCSMYALALLLIGSVYINRKIAIVHILVSITTLVALVAVFANNDFVIPRRIVDMFDPVNASDLVYSASLMGGRINIWSDQWSEISSSLINIAVGKGTLHGYDLTSDNGMLRLWLQAGVVAFVIGVVFWGSLFVRSILNFLRRNNYEHAFANLYILSIIGALFLFEMAADGIFHAKVSIIIAIYAGLLFKINNRQDSMIFKP